MNRSELPIVSPCGVDWQGMKIVDIKKRFCDDCKKHVHDLTRMSRVEARTLLSAPSTEGLCVRYMYDEHGEIVFSGESRIIPASRLLVLKRAIAAATLAAGPLGLAACGTVSPPAPVEPVMVAGGISCPYPPPLPPTAPSATPKVVTPPTY